MEFVGIPVGPFSGRNAIVEAYRHQPPDDAFLTLGAVRRQGAWLVATYAWSSRPEVPAGEVHLRAGSEGIDRVRVLYGRFAGGGEEDVSPEGEATDQPGIRSQPPL